MKGLMLFAVVVLMSDALYAQSCPRGAVCVDQLATSGDGIVIPWSGWNAALLAQPANSHVHFTLGRYKAATRIDAKYGWEISGDGVGSAIETDIPGTLFFLGDPANVGAINPGFVTKHIHIHDLRIVSTNAANVGSGLLFVKSYFSGAERVRVEGFRFGIAFINAISVNVRECTVVLASRADVWLVGNGDYNTTNADLDFHSYPGGGTNLITLTGCSFNGDGSDTVWCGTALAGNAPVLVAIDAGGSDGQYSANVEACNFNGGTTGLRVAGSYRASVSGSHFEGQTVAPIAVRVTTLHGAASMPFNWLEVTHNWISSLMSPLILDNFAAHSVILKENNTATFSPCVSNAALGFIADGMLESLRNNCGGGVFPAAPAAPYVDIGSTQIGVPHTIIAVGSSADRAEEIKIRNGGVSPNALGRIHVQSDTADGFFQAHSSARALSRLGDMLGGYVEVIGAGGKGLLLDTSVAIPIKIGANNVLQMTFSPNGDVTLSNTNSKGTCTLDGQTVATCTHTVPVECVPVCSYMSGGAPSTISCAAIGGLLSVTSGTANDRGIVSYLCF